MTSTSTLEPVPNNSESSDSCQFVPPLYLEGRFWLVSVFGTSVAVISFIENCFLFCIFASSRQHRNSHSFYLLLLAFCDIFIAMAYIPLMSVGLWLDYYQSLVLLKAWFAYMIPMITISHIAMSSSSFLIVAASFERYCITVNSKKVRFFHKFRKQIGVGAILIGVFAKLTLAFEFKIETNPKCIGTMSEYSLSLSDFATNKTYNLVWRLWFRSIVTVLLPFFLLFFVNARIVYVLKKSAFAKILHEKLSEVQRKSRVRAATRTLLLLASTYLFSNIFNVIFTIWEYIDIKSLSQDFYGLYTFGVDLISIATILAGALRLPIYITCQPALLKEFKDFYKNLISTDKLKEELSTSTSNSPYAPVLVRITELLLKYPRGSRDKTILKREMESESESEFSIVGSNDEEESQDQKIVVKQEGGEVFL